jgi:murein DD-endopeptidase MepM/ murein hydrolase activator NlpD
MRLRLRGVAGVVVGLAIVQMAVKAFGGNDLPVAPPILVTSAYIERADTLRRSETLSHLFARHSIVGQELIQLLQAAEPINPRRVRAGQVFQFRYAMHTGTPEQVSVRLGDDRILTLSRDSAQGWSGVAEEIYWSVSTQVARGRVQSSLYETIDELIPEHVLAAGERARLTWDLADGVFGWVVDFTRDNYEGDEFQIAYERLQSDLGDVRFGRILAARIETRGQENTAYVLTDAEGRNVYYDAEGRSLRRAFKLYPAEFRRISSGFSRNRYHPVLKRSRPHLGIDYAAGVGTPIMATGDGTIVRAGRWGSYGIAVAIRHPKDVETRYAHMSSLRSGIRAGRRVRQGQVIGYVGATGMVSGPHLHYEFIKNGRHLDPRSAVKYGEGDGIGKEKRGAFEAVKADYDRLLRSPRAVTQTVRAGLP